MQKQEPAFGLESQQPSDAAIHAGVMQQAPSGWIRYTPLILAYSGFIGLGLVTSRTGVTWPAMQATFGVPLDAIGILLFAHLAGSVLVSASSGRLTGRVNNGVMSAWSCGIIAVTLFGAAATSSWALLVALSALTGLGTGAIEASLNTYAATNFSPRAMNWLHASFGIGATLGPALMTALVASNFSWRVGFVIIGVIEVALAICFGLTSKHWQGSLLASETSPRAHSMPLTKTLRLPVAWLGILLLVAHTGVGTSGGQWFYSVLTEQRGISAALAGTWVSLYWGSLTVGRILFGFVVHRFSPTLVLRASMVGSVLSTILFWLNLAPLISLGSIALLGLMMAPQFPLLMSATPRYLGAQHAANGVGLQVAAAGLGGVLVTSLIGVLAQARGLNVIAPAIVVAAVIMFTLFELLARHMRKNAI